MAATVRWIRLSYENGVNFTMDTKLDDGSWLDVINMDENGHISSLWPGVETVCETFFSEKIEEIGSVMKA